MQESFSNSNNISSDNNNGLLQFAELQHLILNIDLAAEALQVVAPPVIVAPPVNLLVHNPEAIAILEAQNFATDLPKQLFSIEKIEKSYNSAFLKFILDEKEVSFLQTQKELVRAPDEIATSLSSASAEFVSSLFSDLVGNVPPYEDYSDLVSPMGASSADFTASETEIFKN